ncbi:MAG: hypothetical protein R2788_06895 [Saprospiraceae bacterium]
MLLTRAVNAISHYTDWTIGHVQYHLHLWAERLPWALGCCTTRYLKNVQHQTLLYQIGRHPFLGLALWVSCSMPFRSIAGWTQSLMWKEFLPEGILKYGNFLETVTQILPDVRIAGLVTLHPVLFS